MAHQIAVIGGDGIGPEVTAEALKVVRAAGVDLAAKEFDLGGARYLCDGEILSDATLDELRQFDAILLGAVGTPDVPPGVIERGLLLKMRFDLDLYVKNGARPTTASSDGASAAAGSTESITVTNPAAAYWYIGVYVYSGSKSGSYTVTATVS